MKRTDTPRGKRAGMKAWVYLALFGPGDNTDEPTGEATSDTGGDGDETEGDTPEG
jgi:hypothetical protein